MNGSLNREKKTREREEEEIKPTNDNYEPIKKFFIADKSRWKRQKYAAAAVVFYSLEQQVIIEKL